MRDELASCPRCARGLDRRGARLVCEGCQGVLVTEAELQEMIAEAHTHSAAAIVAPAPLAFVAVTVIEPVLRCPSCLSDMAKRGLHGMTVDHCVAHGVWFDGEELQKVLADAGLEGLPAKLPPNVGAGLTIAAFIALRVLWLLA